MGRIDAAAERQKKPSPHLLVPEEIIPLKVQAKPGLQGSQKY
jgi:hypothetical protein